MVGIISATRSNIIYEIRNCQARIFAWLATNLHTEFIKKLMNYFGVPYNSMVELFLIKSIEKFR